MSFQGRRLCFNYTPSLEDVNMLNFILLYPISENTLVLSIIDFNKNALKHIMH